MNVGFKNFFSTMSNSFGLVLTALVLVGMSGIILPYFWYLFWRLRSHFLISARYPSLTLSISCILYTLGVTSTIGIYTLSWYDFDRDKTRSRAISYPIQLVFGQVAALIYRAFLLYVKWDNQELTLQTQSSIIHTIFNSKSNTITIDTLMNNQQNQNSHKIMKYVVISTLIIGFIFLCIILPSFVNPKGMENLRTLFPVPYMMVIILGIVVLFRSRKMKESLLCKRETYMVAILILFNVLLDNLPISLAWKILLSLSLSMFLNLH